MSLLTNCLACYILANQDRLSYRKKSDQLQLVKKINLQKQVIPPTSLSFIKTNNNANPVPEKIKLKKIA